MGECLGRIEEVEGSIPFRSITRHDASTPIEASCVRLPAFDPGRKRQLADPTRGIVTLVT